MMSRLRTVLHLLLAIALVVPGVAAPMQSVRDGLAHAAHAAAPGAMAGMDAAMAMHIPDEAMAGMPCEHMGEADPAPPMQPVAARDPGDCCNPHTCDLSACLGTGCLPELPRIAACVPPATPLVPWRQPAQPARLIETPLRPPIA